MGGLDSLVSRAQKPPACLRRPDHRGSVAAAPPQQNDLLLLKDSCWAHNRTKQPFKTILSYLWIFKPFLCVIREIHVRKGVDFSDVLKGQDSMVCYSSGF